MHVLMFVCVWFSYHSQRMLFFFFFFFCLSWFLFCAILKYEANRLPK